MPINILKGIRQKKLKIQKHEKNQKQHNNIQYITQLKPNNLDFLK